VPKYFKVSGEISGLQAAPYPCVVNGKAFANTTIDNAYAPPPAHPAKRLTLRDISLVRVRHFACSPHGVVFDTCSVENLRGGGMAPSFLMGCVFRRTTLAGWIGGVMWRWQVDFNDPNASQKIHAWNLKFYEGVDWALDITKADFSFHEGLIGVPARLVRRDPDKHFVMTRECANRLMTHKSGSVWDVSAQRLLESPMDDVVIVTGGQGARLEEEMTVARKLRKRGFLT
jgi:hypothetical protein